jgi:hypothetical protein
MIKHHTNTTGSIFFCTKFRERLSKNFKYFFLNVFLIFTYTEINRRLTSIKEFPDDNNGGPLFAPNMYPSERINGSSEESVS